jgi:hypothetical protein
MEARQPPGPLHCSSIIFSALLELQPVPGGGDPSLLPLTRHQHTCFWPCLALAQRPFSALHRLRRRLGGRVGRARVRRAARRLHGPHPRPNDAVVPRRVLAPLEQLVAQRLGRRYVGRRRHVDRQADAMWIGRPSHRCSAITYSVKRSLNWLGPGMACSHAPASGCATPMGREHSRSATFVPRTSLSTVPPRLLPPPPLLPLLPLLCCRRLLPPGALPLPAGHRRQAPPPRPARPSAALQPPAPLRTARVRVDLGDSARALHLVRTQRLRRQRRR